MASTTIVNVNPEQLEKLIEFMSATVGIELNQPSDVKEFTELMCKHADALIEKATEEADAEGCFQALFKDIQLVPDPALAATLVSSITAVVEGKPENKPELRLRVLANLYNVLSVSPSAKPGSQRVFIVVLLSIVKFAAASGQVPMLQGYFDLLDDLVLKWSLSLEDARELFLAVADALGSAPNEHGLQDKAQLFLIKYLATFGTLSSSSGAAGQVPMSPEVRAIAAKGAAGAVRSPIVSFMERHNLVGLEAVASLKGDKEHGALYDLLVILTTGKLHDYLAWHKDHQSVLGKHAGLDHSNLVTNMRLLSLCSLATEHSEIPYAAIAADLDVPEDEVEAWVVRTISAKLIEAKMDQLSRTVLISKCAHRVFGPEQWRVLQAKLASWKTNIKGILETIAKANQQVS